MKKNTQKFTDIFKLNKTQAEIDFVDIDISRDTPLYLDPFALTTKDDLWSSQCQFLLQSFFESIIKAIKDENDKKGFELLSKLNEPEETFLGVSKSGQGGRGIGDKQAAQIFNALKRSNAAKTGLLEDLSDFALYIHNIGRDKISDLTTNIIRGELIKYTQNICDLHNIKMRSVASGFFWDADEQRWHQDYVDLPVFDNNKILLVPKFSVRYQVNVNHDNFYNKYVVEYLRAEHDRPGDSLITAIKDKKGKIIREKVYKKTIKKHYPNSKNFLADFSADHLCSCL